MSSHVQWMHEGWIGPPASLRPCAPHTGRATKALLSTLVKPVRILSHPRGLAGRRQPCEAQ